MTTWKKNLRLKPTFRVIELSRIRHLLRRFGETCRKVATFLYNRHTSSSQSLQNELKLINSFLSLSDRGSPNRQTERTHTEWKPADRHLNITLSDAWGISNLSFLHQVEHKRIMKKKSKFGDVLKAQHRRNNVPKSAKLLSILRFFEVWPNLFKKIRYTAMNRTTTTSFHTHLKFFFIFQIFDAAQCQSLTTPSYKKIWTCIPRFLSAFQNAVSTYSKNQEVLHLVSKLFVK